MKYLFLLMLSCAATKPLPQPECATICGMRFAGPVKGHSLPVGWSCERFQFAAVKAYKMLSNLNGMDRACRESAHYVVEVRNERAWRTPDFDEGKSAVLALTDCGDKRMWLNNEMPEHGSLLHELAHVAQDCTAIQPKDRYEDAAHANWSRDGIRAAEQEFHGGESYVGSR